MQFDGIDEVFEAMRKSEENVNRSLVRQQREVVWGSYWITFRPEYGCVIAGYIPTLAEFLAEEKLLGSDDEELIDSEAHEREMYDRGYRFGKAYSVMCVEGEYGSTHIGTMIGPITKEQFEEAQALKWDNDAILELPWFRALYFSGIQQMEELT